MNWEAIGAIGEIIGAAGVIATLVYLAIQIRQNTKTVASNTTQEISSTASNSLVGILQAPQMVDVMHRAFVGGGPLEPKDQFALDLYLRALTRNFENFYYQYTLGNLLPEIWAGYETALLEPLSQDFGQDYWKRNKHVFGTSFVSHIDVLLAESGKVPRVMGIVTNNESAT